LPPLRSSYRAVKLPSMKKILVVQPSLQPPGGGNVVAAWMIEALKRDHAVSVLTWRPIDLEEINRYCGTSLCESDFTALQVSPTLRALFRLLPVPLTLLRSNLLLRSAKQIVGDYDIPISVNNEADLGRMGIQYIHFPWAYQPRPPTDLRWYHGSSGLVALYYQLCERVSDFSFERMKRNFTLVNSNWTGAKIKECHGIDSETLYPPIPGVFPEIPWSGREDGFVCIGRISPEKELDKVIDILAAVRARGRDVHLHIVGTADNPDYYTHIRRRVRDDAAWISLAEDLSRDDLAKLVSQHRYGIHGMAEEHFGMAIAEMIRAGCIVFVPRGGGQREIVEGEDRLSYATMEEAVQNILQVLGDAEAQSELREYLATRKDLFSTERFTRTIRDIVDRF
jgi:glycosyltransferase involved in cell wall biosynthesis